MHSHNPSTFGSSNALPTNIIDELISNLNSSLPRPMPMNEQPEPSFTSQPVTEAQTSQENSLPPNGFILGLRPPTSPVGDEQNDQSPNSAKFHKMSAGERLYGDDSYSDTLSESDDEGLDLEEMQDDNSDEECDEAQEIQDCGLSENKKPNLDDLNECKGEPVPDPIEWQLIEGSVSASPPAASDSLKAHLSPVSASVVPNESKEQQDQDVIAKTAKASPKSQPIAAIVGTEYALSLSPASIEIQQLHTMIQSTLQQIDFSAEHAEWIQIALGPNISTRNTPTENIFQRLENANAYQLYRFFDKFLKFREIYFREDQVLDKYHDHIQVERAKIILDNAKQVSQLQKQYAEIKNKDYQYPITLNKGLVQQQQNILATLNQMKLHPERYDNDKIKRTEAKLTETMTKINDSLKQPASQKVSTTVAEKHKKFHQKVYESAASQFYWESEEAIYANLRDGLAIAYREHLKETFENPLSLMGDNKILIQSLQSHRAVAMTELEASWQTHNIMTETLKVRALHTLLNRKTQLMNHDVIIQNPMTDEANALTFERIIADYIDILNIPTISEIWVSTGKAKNLQKHLNELKDVIIDFIVESNYHVAQRDNLFLSEKNSTDKHPVATKIHHAECLKKLWNSIFERKEWKTFLNNNGDKKVNFTDLQRQMRVLRDQHKSARLSATEKKVQEAKKTEKANYTSATKKWLQSHSVWLAKHPDLVSNLIKNLSVNERCDFFISARGDAVIHPVFTINHPDSAELTQQAFQLYLKAPDAKKSNYIKVLSILFQQGATLPADFNSQIDDSPSPYHWLLIAEYLKGAPIYSPLAITLTEQLAMYVKGIDNSSNLIMALFRGPSMAPSIKQKLLSHITGIAEILQYTAKNDQLIFNKLSEIADSKEAWFQDHEKNQKLKELAINIRQQLESRTLLSFDSWIEMKNEYEANKLRQAETMQEMAKQLKESRQAEALRKAEIEELKKDQLKAKAELEAINAATKAELEAKNATMQADFKAKLEEKDQVYEARFQELARMIAGSELAAKPAMPSEPVAKAVTYNASSPRLFKPASVEIAQKATAPAASSTVKNTSATKAALA